MPSVPRHLATHRTATWDSTRTTVIVDGATIDAGRVRIHNDGTADLFDFGRGTSVQARLTDATLEAVDAGSGKFSVTGLDASGQSVTWEIAQTAKVGGCVPCGKRRR